MLRWIHSLLNHAHWAGAALAFLGTSALYLRLGHPPVEPEPPDAGPLAVTTVSYERTAMAQPEFHIIGSGQQQLDEAYRKAGTATEGREGLLRSIELIAAGCDYVQSIPDYTATFIRQENINGTLGDPETIDLKVRHAPFSIYLHWSEGASKGRELLYVDGQNDGDMIYHSGGWKGRLLPPLKLNPRGQIALSHARHPVTDLGLVGVGRRTVKRRHQDMAEGGSFRFRMDENAEFDGRPALFCELEFEAPSNPAVFRKSLYWIDRDLLVPVGMKNYGWLQASDLTPEQIDEETLLEDYSFVNIRLRSQLADRDFDTRNEEYHFRR